MKKRNIKTLYFWVNMISLAVMELLNYYFLKDLLENDLYTGLAVSFGIYIGLIVIMRTIINKMMPEEAARVKRESKDERAKLIRGLASFYTMIFMGIAYFFIAILPEEYLFSPFGINQNYPSTILSVLIITMFFYMFVYFIVDMRKQ